MYSGQITDFDHSLTDIRIRKQVPPKALHRKWAQMLVFSLVDIPKTSEEGGILPDLYVYIPKDVARRQPPAFATFVAQFL
jgi:hypothetical protein